MAINRELPQSFDDAMRMTVELLSRNHDLVRKQVVQAEAEQLVSSAYRSATGKALPRMELYARLGDRYPTEAAKALLLLAHQRSNGKLLQHLTGKQVFLNHEYDVGPDVLIPRPETEVLVSAAIDQLLTEAPQSVKLGYEIGLGSGIISIELLARFPGLHMRASELSPAARVRARANAVAVLGNEIWRNRLEILEAKSPTAVWEPFIEKGQGKGKGVLADFLISNPPYLMADDEIEADVKASEPAQALFSPTPDPLYFYRTIAERAGEFVRPGGWIFLEVPHERARNVVALFEAKSYSARVLNDLTGRERVVIARQSGSK